MHARQRVIGMLFFALPVLRRAATGRRVAAEARFSRSARLRYDAAMQWKAVAVNRPTIKEVARSARSLKTYPSSPLVLDLAPDVPPHLNKVTETL